MLQDFQVEFVRFSNMRLCRNHPRWSDESCRLIMASRSCTTSSEVNFHADILPVVLLSHKTLYLSVVQALSANRLRLWISSAANEIRWQRLSSPLFSETLSCESQWIIGSIWTNRFITSFSFEHISFMFRQSSSFPPFFFLFYSFLPSKWIWAFLKIVGFAICIRYEIHADTREERDEMAEAIQDLISYNSKAVPAKVSAPLFHL